MLTDEKKQQLSKVTIVDMIEYFGAEQVIQCFDPLHIVVVLGEQEVYNALLRFYENASHQ